MNHHENKTVHTHRKAISPEQDIATRLSANALFQGGQNAPFRLYTKVPIHCLERAGLLLEDYALENDDYCMAAIIQEEYYFLDLLVCSHDGQAVLGLVCSDCEPDPKPVFPVLDGTGLMLMQLPPSGYDDAWEQTVLDHLRSWRSPGQPEPQEDSVVRLEAHPLHVGRTSKRLMKARMLSPDAKVTTYGLASGLFAQYSMDASGRTNRKLVTTAQDAVYIQRVLDGSLEADQGNSRAPLAKRLECLRQDRPTDGRYAGYAVGSLRQLLETPLDELCAGDAEALKLLKRDLELGRGMLGHDDEIPAPTYADVLETVHDLYTKYRADDREKLMQGAVKLLAALGNQLLQPKAQLPLETADAEKPSLKERLRGLPAQDAEDDRRLRPADCYDVSGQEPVRARDYSILCMPMSYYFYAASVLDGSDYLNWFYKTKFYAENLLGMMGRRNSDLCDPTFVLQWIKNHAMLNGPDSMSADAFLVLYDMLVEPIFPSMG